MAKLDEEKIKKLRRGETIGNVSLVGCAAAAIYFIVGFTVARTQNMASLQLAVLISAPLLLAAAAAAAAFCNLRYSAAIDREIARYVLDVCVENAAAFHPERDLIAFTLLLENARVALQVNGYKEKIVFDFAPLGRLSAMRKLSVLTEIENRLCITFCRLYERGAAYREVAFSERDAMRKKSKKKTYIIENGVPDKRAYRQYLKNK